jgi:hypothetical protein
MTNEELAATIRDKFTPMVFNCSCDGADPSCAAALEDRAVWAQKSTADRIAEFITALPKS